MLLFLSFLFPALIIAAAAYDVSTFKIPNRLTAIMLVTWPLAAFAIGMPAVQWALSGIMAGIVFLGAFGIFAAGWFGAGDAKLLPVVALWVGPTNVFPFLIYTALAGAVVSIVMMGVRSRPLPVWGYKVGWLVELHGRERDIPYGLAIAVAALILWPKTAFFGF